MRKGYLKSVVSEDTKKGHPDAVRAAYGDNFDGAGLYS